MTARIYFTLASAACRTRIPIHTRTRSIHYYSNTRGRQSSNLNSYSLMASPKFTVHLPSPIQTPAHLSSHSVSNPATSSKSSLLLPVPTASLSTSATPTTPTPPSHINQPSPSAPLFLPPPPTAFPLHISLKPFLQSNPQARILILGDIHGCADELRELLTNLQFTPQSRKTRGDLIIAAGDLVGKGWKSQEVIELLMEYDALAVLGNHDQYMLRCALLAGLLGVNPLNDNKPFSNDIEIGSWASEAEVARYGGVDDPNYARCYYGRMNGFTSSARPNAQHFSIAKQLTEKQLTWMSTLPLSIDLAPFYPYLVVHAGVVPSLPLSKQHPYHLMTLRNFVPTSAHDSSAGHRIDACVNSVNKHGANEPVQPYESIKVGCAWSMRIEEVAESERKKLEAGQEAKSVHVAGSSNTSSSSTGEVIASSAAVNDVAVPTEDNNAATTMMPSASRSIVFGHDAARGFQRPNKFRLGIDTGCCNGKFLTGFLLPEQRVYNVKARQVYSSPKGDTDVARFPPAPSGTQLDAIPFVEPAKARGATGPNSPTLRANI